MFSAKQTLPMHPTLSGSRRRLTIRFHVNGFSRNPKFPELIRYRSIHGCRTADVGRSFFKILWSQVVQQRLAGKLVKIQLTGIGELPQFRSEHHFIR